MISPARACTLGGSFAVRRAQRTVPNCHAISCHDEIYPTVSRTSRGSWVTGRRFTLELKYRTRATGRANSTRRTE